MIEDVVLKESEFSDLSLKKVDTFASDTIYKGKEPNVLYLLSLKHDIGVGLYYDGIKINCGVQHGKDSSKE